tara:strand:- start:1447 stop:1659 length:213 start_codon:yes stop_codon:yes gene_type:complete
MSLYVENMHDVHRILSRLDRAYNNAEDVRFKKLWLDKWNQFVTDYKDIAGNLKPRDFEYEQSLNKGGKDD